MEKEHRRELRDDLARALYNLAWGQEKQRAMRVAIQAVHETRKLWEDLVKQGMNHLERPLLSPRNWKLASVKACSKSQFAY